MKELSRKEELFCRLYVSCRNPREAAYRAGFRVCSEIAAKKLLAKRNVREYAEKLRKEAVFPADEVKAGLHRIAFSTSADAVKLLFSDGEDIDIESLDLFNVSEIKRPKGGGLEIKFFDRIKALEKLGDISDMTGENAATPFYEALEKSAMNFGGDKE